MTTLEKIECLKNLRTDKALSVLKELKLEILGIKEFDALIDSHSLTKSIKLKRNILVTIMIVKNRLEIHNSEALSKFYAKHKIKQLSHYHYKNYKKIDLTDFLVSMANYIEPRIPKMKNNQLKNIHFYIDELSDINLILRCSVTKYSDSHWIQVFLGYSVNWNHIVDDYINNKPGNSTVIGSYTIDDLRSNRELESKMDLFISKIKELKNTLEKGLLSELPEKVFWRKYDPENYNLRIRSHDKLALINYNNSIKNHEQVKTLAKRLIQEKTYGSIKEYLEKIINGH